MDEYIMKLAYDTFHIPCCYCSKEEVYYMPGEEEAIVKYMKKHKKALLEYALQYQEPALYVDDQMICNCVLLDRKGGLYIFGPFLRWNLVDAQLKDFWHANQIPGEYIPPIANIGTVIQMIALVYYSLTGSHIDYQNGLIPYVKKVIAEDNLASKMLDDIQLSQDSNTIISSSDETTSGNAYKLEEQMLLCIENGDLDGLHKLIAGPQVQTIRVGILSQDERKNHEYLIVSFITLACRAAMRGGLSPAIAYAKSDIYLQQLSHAKSIQEMNRVPFRMQQDFTEQIHLLKTSKRNSSMVEAAKDYIHLHLKEPIQITDIAQALEVSPSYLSHRFSAEEGMSLKQYLLNRRCYYAANMLHNSRYPISRIAEYFCFSSQSHFGEVFKKQYGMTPREYREGLS